MKARIKWFRNWLSHKKRKEIITTILLTISAILGIVSAGLQNQYSEIQSNLSFKLGTLAVVNSALSANTSEIILDRSVQDLCERYKDDSTFFKGGCGSNKIILQGAVLQRDALRGSSAQAGDELNKYLTDYSKNIDDKSFWISITNASNFLILLVAIVINIL